MLIKDVFELAVLQLVKVTLLVKCPATTLHVGTGVLEPEGFCDNGTDQIYVCKVMDTSSSSSLPNERKGTKYSGRSGPASQKRCLPLGCLHNRTMQRPLGQGIQFQTVREKFAIGGTTTKDNVNEMLSGAICHRPANGYQFLVTNTFIHMLVIVIIVIIVLIFILVNFLLFFLFLDIGTNIIGANTLGCKASQ